MAEQLPYNALSALFTGHLNQYMQGLGSKAPAELYEPESYILSLGGKRLRPLLALIGSDLFGGAPGNALDAALAVELFHNFSLIHDDILDEAPLRRGKPTVHMRWNKGIALLSGDVMLVKALGALKSYPAVVYKHLSTLLHDTAVRVCEGQQLDMNFERQGSVTVNDYLGMISLKTACLLGCSLQMGAIVADADQESQAALYDFGLHTGVAFQLMDDLLDAFGQPGKFGKQLGGDILANKKTYLALKAAEDADVKTGRALKAAMEASPEKKVEQTLAVFRALDVETKCREEAARHTRIAISALERITVAPPEKREALRLFTEQLLNREQ